MSSHSRAISSPVLNLVKRDMRINKTHNRGKTSAPKTKNSNIVNDILPIVEKYLKEQRNLLG